MVGVAVGGAGLGILAALSVAVPYDPARTLSLLAVGTGAPALVTGLALAFVCARAATSGTAGRGRRAPSTSDDCSATRQ